MRARRVSSLSCRANLAESFMAERSSIIIQKAQAGSEKRHGYFLRNGADLREFSTDYALGDSLPFLHPSAGTTQGRRDGRRASEWRHVPSG
jgi:hypothetical protein